MSEIEYLGKQYLGWTRNGWPDERKGPLAVSFHWAEIAGRAECVGIDIRTFVEEPPPRKLRTTGPAGLQPVTASGIRRIPLTRLMDRAREAKGTASYLTAKRLKYVTEKARARAREHLPLFEKPPRKGRGGRPPEYDRAHFEQVAKIYRKAPTAKRTKAVADFFTVSSSAAAKWVRRARDMGLIEEPPAKRTRPRKAR
jgi:hypothetical protein